MDNQLTMLEERIGKAITFIETLKAKEKTLADEKEVFETKIQELEAELTEKDRTIEELMENQVFLKNKIEAVLNKLESLANFDMGSTQEEEVQAGTPPEPDETVEEPAEDLGKMDKPESEGPTGSGGIYVEENIVDFKSNDETDQNPLFDANADSDTKSGERPEEKASVEKSKLLRSTDQDKGTFNGNPFLEM
jgi:hypothetical protein